MGDQSLAVGLLHLRAPTETRVFLVLPFFVGFYGLFAGMTGICGLSGLLGRRLTAQGSEPIVSPEERRSVRRLGLEVLLAIATASSLATWALVWAG